MTEYSGKVAMVTGGGAGIGRAIMETFLQKGIKVCAVDFDETAGQNTCAEFKTKYGDDNVMFCKCDVSDSAQLQDAFKQTLLRFGKLDILCNNAAIMNESKLQAMIKINLGGVIEGTLLGIKYMSKEEGGRGGVIINTASGAGLVPFYPGPAYSATKFGVIGFSMGVASDPRRAADGVRVMCLCPSFTDTNLIKLDDKPGAVTDVEAFKQIGSHFPDSKPADVAEKFLMLVDESAENGSVLLLDRTGPRFIKLAVSYADIPSKC